ncbi:MAG: TonB-dependent receptor, partial [Bacteroidota bacterium]|nr:TonB-dependent receptor [Bacteroidota bacterium]
TKLTTTAGFMFGKDSWSGLTWYNAPDPRPDYYRYLPSYSSNDYDEIRQIIIQNWQNDVNTRQIDWDHLYQINYLANLAGKQAAYIQENNVTKYHQFSLNSHLDKEVNDHISLNGGMNFSFYKANHYKEIMDMLGGNYWVDVDQYAERDFPGDSLIAQNDINNPNRIVHKGDKFGYDYDAHINSGQLWGQGNFTYNKVDYYAAVSLSDTWFWRTGNMKNGRHPNNSFGDSKHYNYLNYGIRGGLTYKISGRHFLTVNGIYKTEAPYFNNAFISPKTRDDVAPGLTSQKIYGGDINYILRYPWIKARLTYFYTQFRDGTEISSFYHDDYRTFVNYSLSGIDELHQGIEFGAEVKTTKWLSLFGVASVGNYIYTSRATGTVSYDNGSKPDTTSTVYMKNFYVPGNPQTALSGGFKINYKYWWIDLNANYYSNNWLDFYPGRRTEAAIANLGPGDPLITEITEQKELKGGFTMDCSIGKSIMINHKLFINLNLSVTNLLDNKDIQSGGYEQNRFDFTTRNISEFPPKYYYYFGRTVFLNISIRI